MTQREIWCHIASTKQELDDALRVRWEVFSQEKGYVKEETFRVSREVDVLDTLESTVHIVAYVSDRPVGTARLLLANPRIARENELLFGIDLDLKFDLSPLHRSGILIAETTRVCVLHEYRRAGVFDVIYAALRRESLARGVTHWVASANTETDDLDDARIAHRVAGRMGLLSDKWAVVPRHSGPSSQSPRISLYSTEERERAARGDLLGLRFPATLRLYARKGARFIGGPIFDPKFRMCSMPLVLELISEQVRSELRHAA